MSHVKALNRSRIEQLLADAIDRQRPIVLTHHGPDGWHSFKSRFVSGSFATRRIQAKPPECSVGADMPPLKAGDSLGVTFRAGHKKCAFGTALRAAPQAGHDGLLELAWPDHLQQLRRRVYERVRPPGNLVIAVRFWLEPADGGPGADARTVRYGQLEDLSVGGMRVKVALPHDIRIGATYRCAFTPGEGKPPMVLDAMVRHRETIEKGRASIGFQFVGLEVAAEGRRLAERLARIVSGFQRAGSRKRRHRSPG
jgi:hypothetical protein